MKDVLGKEDYATDWNATENKDEDLFDNKYDAIEKKCDFEEEDANIFDKEARRWYTTEKHPPLQFSVLFCSNPTLDTS